MMVDAYAQRQLGASGASDPEQRRTTLYQQGVDAVAVGRWDLAKDRFAAALAIRESPKVLFSLAQAEEHVGELARASAHYQRALEIAKAAGESDVVAAAERMLPELASRVPHVTIVVSGSSDATVTLDGEPVAVGSAVAVNPGTHRVVARAPGMADGIATIALSEHQSLEVPLRLERAASTPPAPMTPEASARPAGVGAHVSPWRVVAGVTAGTGLVAAGVGTYFGLHAKSKFDQSNRSGCSGDACTAGGAAIRHDALSSATASDVAFGIGGVLIAAGIALWFLAPSSQLEPRVSVAPGAFVVSGKW
jgi:hypothetical protein